MSFDCCTPPALRANELPETLGPVFHKAVQRAIATQTIDKGAITGTDPAAAPGLKYGFTCSKLCAWIYEPTADRCVVYNELPVDVVLFCKETKQRVYSRSWRPTCVVSKLAKGLMPPKLEIAVYRADRYQDRFTPRNPFFGRIMVFEASPNHTYRLRLSDASVFKAAKVQLVLESRTLLPPYLTLDHLELAEGENIVQWALLTVRSVVSTDTPVEKQDHAEESSTKAEAELLGPKHEPGTVFLVFRGIY